MEEIKKKKKNQLLVRKNSLYLFQQNFWPLWKCIGQYNKNSPFVIHQLIL